MADALHVLLVVIIDEIDAVFRKTYIGRRQ
jgi:hypothetical protein